MTYRKLLFTGAMCATIGLTAGSALAQQTGQQQQTRPGQASPVNGKEFLSQLEGNWDVEVTIYDMDAFEKSKMTRTGQSPGQQPGQRPGGQENQQRTQQQIQQQLEQAFVRAGVSQQQAQTHAQQLALRINREKPERQELQQMIQQEMTRAGVSQTQAQQEAQRVAGQVSTLIRDTDSGRELDPEDDPTADPIRPGQQGQTPSRDRDRATTTPGRTTAQGQGQAQFTGEGNAKRSWKLNENFLQEELTFKLESEGQSTRPGLQRQTQSGQQSEINLRDGDEYEGHGMFAFEGPTGDLCMVWADNTKSMLNYGIAKYDSSQQAMVFYTIDPEKITLPGTTTRPGMRPIDRQTPGGPQVGQQTRTTGQSQEQLRLDQDGTRMVLRIVSDNEHVVHIYRDNGIGSATRVAEITYTRAGGSQRNN